jgi:hypothetical protein
MLRRGLCTTCLLMPVLAHATVAENPIYSGLGVSLGLPLPAEAQGAEVAEIPHARLPDNHKLEMPSLIPGRPLPWRHLSHAKLPRPLRDQRSQTFVMVNDAAEVMRVLGVSHSNNCQHFDWLKATLEKKYDVQGDSEISPTSPYQRALRIEFLSKQIDVRCGPDLVLDYLDAALINAWSRQQNKLYMSHQREQAAIDKRRMVLERRQAIKFADQFTLGDQYRLEGAFGIQFQSPFAKNSTQVFPVDEPFYAVLPNIPEPFDDGDISIVISPQKHPIVIRGQFERVDFDKIANALKAKYGHPMKASSRHIIHKVNGNHAIVKKVAENTIELAFIDTAEQAQQRKRLWAKESEGL